MADQHVNWFVDVIYSAENVSSCPNGSHWIWSLFNECTVDGRDVASVYLGLISILCFILSSIPQYYRSCKSGNMDKALSIWFLLGWLSGDSCNLIGAFLANQLPLQKYTAVYYVCADLVMLALYLYYKYRNRRSHLSHSINSVCVFVLLGSAAAISLHSRIGPGPESDVRMHSRKLLSSYGSGTELFPKLEIIGLAVGSVSSVLYLTSRLPQIITNFRRRSTEGLALSLFCLVILGNLTYGISVLLKNPENGQSEGSYVLRHLPWIVGSLGVMSLDVIIICQFLAFRKKITEVSNANETDPLLPKSNCSTSWGDV